MFCNGIKPIQIKDLTNLKYAITQDDAWTYEMYGLCTLHVELDLVNKDHNKNSLGHKQMNTKI